MNVVIIGCGKTGSRLAVDLDKLGHDVAVVDSDKSKFSLLSNDFSGLCISGSATDVDVLKNAGCDNADVAVIVTNSDNVNVMAARVMDYEFGVKDTYVRISEPSREAVFRKLGLKTVSPTRIESEIFMSLVTDIADTIESVRMGGITMRFYTVKADRKDEDKTPAEIPCKTGEMLFAVKKRDASLHLANESHLYIEQGDKLIYAVL